MFEDEDEKKLEEFEERTGVRFNDKKLLRQAFIHRSYVNENRSRRLKHNERLEFLGDAVLELVVTNYLFNRYPEKTEGDLTALRSALVNTSSLFATAKELSLNELLYLSRGESRDEGRAREYILANVVEALIGAVYLDKGFSEAEIFVEKFILKRVEEIVKGKLWIDAKSYFQEKAQEMVGETPAYKVIEEEGPDHNKVFTSGVYLKEELIASGDGKSKQEAEQKAAEKALEKKSWK